MIVYGSSLSPYVRKVLTDRHPQTRAFVERILARPSLAHWVERERAFLERTAA